MLPQCSVAPAQWQEPTDNQKYFEENGNKYAPFALFSDSLKGTMIQKGYLKSLYMWSEFVDQFSFLFSYLFQEIFLKFYYNMFFQGD